MVDHRAPSARTPTVVDYSIAAKNGRTACSTGTLQPFIHAPIRKNTGRLMYAVFFYYILNVQMPSTHHPDTNRKLLGTKAGKATPVFLSSLFRPHTRKTKPSLGLGCKPSTPPPPPSPQNLPQNYFEVLAGMAKGEHKTSANTYIAFPDIHRTAQRQRSERNRCSDDPSVYVKSGYKNQTGTLVLRSTE